MADACGRLEPSDALRVVAGHGAVDAMRPESRGPELISLQGVEAALDAGLVHYVALGDRHSTTSVGETGRVWYSGAPEPTDFDEVDPGNVLVVDLDGEQPRVEPHRVGTWSFVQDRDHLRQQIEIEQLTERRDRVSEAQEALQSSEEVLEHSRVDDSLVAEIEDAHIAVQRARAAFDAGTSTVTTTALRQVSLSIDGEERSLAPGESHHRNVGAVTKLTIADAATVAVEPGKGANDLAAELEQACSDLRRLCETAGVADLADVRRAAERRRDAQRQRSAAADTIKQDLRDLTPDVLSSKISGLNRRVAD